MRSQNKVKYNYEALELYLSISILSCFILFPFMFCLHNMFERNNVLFTHNICLVTLVTGYCQPLTVYSLKSNGNKQQQHNFLMIS